MESTPRSSFIPRQAMAGAIPQKVRSRQSLNLVNIAVRVLFVAALLSAAGLFGYKLYLERALASEQAELRTLGAQFSANQLESVYAFDAKLKLGQALLDAHLSPSKIFTALEEATKASIQYTSFKYTRDQSGETTITIDGVTDDFGKVALQKMAYSNHTLLDTVTVTNVSLSTGGAGTIGSEVVFSITATLPVSDIAYEAPMMEPVTETTVGTTTNMGTSTPAVSPVATSSPTQ